MVDNMQLKRKLTDLCIQANVGRQDRRKRRKTVRHRPPLAAAHAPINTTQFLMDDNNRVSPTSDWERFNNSSESEEGQYERNQFVNDYERVKNDRYKKMCKTELIQEYFTIEKAVNLIEKKYKQLQASVRNDKPDPKFNVGVIEQIRIYQSEITKLSQENVDLAAENERLTAENVMYSTVGSDDSTSSSSDDSSSDDSSSDDTSSDEEDHNRRANGGQQQPMDELQLSDGRTDNTG